MYLAKSNFSDGDVKYFKGTVYEAVPAKYADRFVLLDERKIVEIGGELVETAERPRKRRG